MSHECCFCAEEISGDDLLAIRIAISNLKTAVESAGPVQEAYAHAACMSRSLRPGFIFDAEALAPD